MKYYSLCIMLAAIKIFVSTMRFLDTRNTHTHTHTWNRKEDVVRGEIAGFGIETKSVEQQDFEEVDRDTKLEGMGRKRRRIKEGWKTKQQPLSGSRIRSYG